MKTIKEWLETLPSPYRHLAITNHRNAFKRKESRKGYSSLKDALEGAFL